MKKPKEDKKIRPVEDKELSAEGQLVKIRFRPGRGATGVDQDANRFAFVDAKTADTLISLGYADAVIEPSSQEEEQSSQPEE